VREARVGLAHGEEHRVEPGDLQAVPATESVRKGYDPDRGSAALILASAGIEGTYGIGEGVAGLGRIGLRLDLQPLSIGVRVRADHQRAHSDRFGASQSGVGVELEIARLEQIRGPWWFGIGVRGGVGGAYQSFATDGHAPERSALVGHAGSTLRLERALKDRGVIGLDAGLDGLAYPGEDGAPRTIVRPLVQLEVGTYVW
jgi:hypothetical protein